MEDFQFYKEAEDVEQFRISWKKVNESGAHLVAKGFEKPKEVTIDSPNAEEGTLLIAPSEI